MVTGAAVIGQEGQVTIILCYPMDGNAEPPSRPDKGIALGHARMAPERDP